MKVVRALTRRDFIYGSIGFCTALSGVTLAGCGSSTPIVGKWKKQGSSDPSVEFKEDGTFSYTNSTFTKLGTLEGKWRAYKNNPVEVNGEKWFVYTTDSDMGSSGKGTHSDDIDGKYEKGRNDFVVKNDIMYAAVGWTLTKHDSFNEEAIIKYINNPYCATEGGLTYRKA